MRADAQARKARRASQSVGRSHGRLRAADLVFSSVLLFPDRTGQQRSFNTAIMGAHRVAKCHRSSCLPANLHSNDLRSGNEARQFCSPWFSVVGGGEYVTVMHSPLIGFRNSTHHLLFLCVKHSGVSLTTRAIAFRRRSPASTSSC